MKGDRTVFIINEVVALFQKDLFIIHCDYIQPELFVSSQRQEGNERVLDKGEDS